VPGVSTPVRRADAVSKRSTGMGANAALVADSRHFQKTRDNGFVPVPIGYVNQAQLEQAVSEAAQALDAREVREVRFTLGPDPDGEPSIFFGVLLTPYAIQASRFADVTRRVTTALFDRLQPYNRWGLQSYFNFTSDLAHFGKPGWM
jgi:hypothetical protein